MSNKKTGVSIQVDENFIAMFDRINEKLSYGGSRSAIVKEAVRRMYRQEFPSYQGKPAPMPSGGSVQQINSVAKARVASKSAEKTAEMIQQIENAEAVAQILGGHLVGKSGEIKEMRIVHSRVDNTKMQEVEVSVATQIPYVSEGLTGQSKLNLLELKFRDGIFEGDEDEQRKRGASKTEAMILGMQRGDITPKHLTPDMLGLYIEHLDNIKVDTKALLAQMSEGGFSAT